MRWRGWWCVEDSDPFGDVGGELGGGEEEGKEGAGRGEDFLAAAGFAIPFPRLRKPDSKDERNSFEGGVRAGGRAVSLPLTDGVEAGVALTSLDGEGPSSTPTTSAICFFTSISFAAARARASSSSSRSSWSRMACASRFRDGRGSSVRRVTDVSLGGGSGVDVGTGDGGEGVGIGGARVVGVGKGGLRGPIEGFQLANT